MNKVIDLRIRREEVIGALIIYGLLILVALFLEARFDRLGLNTNCISNENISYFISR